MGIVLVANVDGVKPGELVLDGATAADIFLGKITRWNAPQIAKLNSGVKPPDADVRSCVAPTVRGRPSTSPTTLSRVSEEWKNKVAPIPRSNGRSASAPKGNDGVAGNVGQTKNAIGYVEYAYAKQNKMTHVDMINSAGKRVSRPWPSSGCRRKRRLVGSAWLLRPHPVEPAGRPVPMTAATFILMRRTHRQAASAAKRSKFSTGRSERRQMASERTRLHPDAREREDMVRKTWAAEIKNKFIRHAGAKAIPRLDPVPGQAFGAKIDECQGRLRVVKRLPRRWQRCDRAKRISASEVRTGAPHLLLVDAHIRIHRRFSCSGDHHLADHRLAMAYGAGFSSGPALGSPRPHRPTAVSARSTARWCLRFIAMLIAVPSASASPCSSPNSARNGRASRSASRSELLAGIPSIIYGMWGFSCSGRSWPTFPAFHDRILRNRAGARRIFAGPPSYLSLFNASLFLAIMVLPFITADFARRVQDRAAGAEGSRLRDRLHHLGSGQMSSFPTRVGVIGGVMLALGRALRRDHGGHLHHRQFVPIASSIFAPDDHLGGHRQRIRRIDGCASIGADPARPAAVRAHLHRPRRGAADADADREADRSLTMVDFYASRKRRSSLS